MRTSGSTTRALIWVSVIVLAGLAAPAGATDYQWNSQDADWNTPNAWSPPGIPNMSHNALVDNGGTARIHTAPNALALNMWVGQHQAGTVVQDGADAWFGVLKLGENAGSSGSYVLTGSNHLDPGDWAYIGMAGIGSFTQTNGAVDVHLDLYLGFFVGGSGTYSLSGGSLHAGSEIVGRAGAGQFDHTGGMNTVTTLTIGQNGPGCYRLSGTGALNAVARVQVYPSGRFEWFGGTLTTPQLRLEPDGTLAMGYDFNVIDTVVTPGVVSGLSLATLEVTNGAVATHDHGTLSANWLKVGSNAGGGTYNLTGTGLLSAPLLTVGDSPTASVFNWTGTSLSLNTSRVAILPNGCMNVFQDWEPAAPLLTVLGTLDVKGNVLTLDGEAASCIVGGSLLGDTVRVGRAEFLQIGGHTCVGSFVNGGGGGSGAYTKVTGGTLEATRLLQNNSIFEQEGGQVIATTFENVGYNEVTLSGGTLEADLFTNGGGRLPAAMAPAGGTVYVRGNSVVKADTIVNYTDFRLNSAGTIRGRTNLEGTFINYGQFYMDVTEMKDGRQRGGTFEDRLVNHGYFEYSGGDFNGALEHRTGWFSQAKDFTAGRGIYNYGDLQVQQWMNMYGNGPDGVVNYGQLWLTGGILGGTKVVNDYGAYLYANGTIGTDFENNGTLEPEATLTITGNTTNRGAIYIDNLERVEVKKPMSNSGYIEFRRGWGEFPQTGGVLAGQGLVTNEYGGYILMDGGGSITAPIVNNGQIGARNSMNLVITSLTDNGGIICVGADTSLNLLSNLTNSGVIVLAKPFNAKLSGGVITNSGSLSGSGQVANTVINEGVIAAAPLAQAYDAPYGLVLSGSGCTNAAGGRIEVPQDCILAFTRGLATNAGTIALDGGTFDNNARPMTNTGILSGHGTFDTGALTNALGGQIRVADQPTLFYGPLVNSGNVQVFSCTTTFFDHATNNTSGEIKNTSGIIRFLGGFTNSGSYVSDPADNYFTDLTNTVTGYLVGREGDRFIVTGNFANDSTRTDAWNTAGAELRFTGGTVHTMAVSGPVSTFGWGALAVEPGNTLTLAGVSTTAADTANSSTINQIAGIANLGKVGGPGSLSVAADAALAAAHVRQNSLAVAGTVTVAPDGTDGGTSVVNVLTIAGGATPTGRLDLANNDLIWDYPEGVPRAPSIQFENVKQWIASGYNNRTWTGNGIASSAAALDPVRYGLGYAQNDMLFNPYNEFSGQPVDLTSVLVKYTYLGDVNLDGKVDDNDVTIMVLGYDRGRVSTHTWQQGDVFGYDGKIDDNDITVLVLNYRRGIGSPLGEAAAAVPEPATLSLLALGGLVLAFRRRGRRGRKG
jgi:hypothetical protein